MTSSARPLATVLSRGSLTRAWPSFPGLRVRSGVRLQTLAGWCAALVLVGLFDWVALNLVLGS